jgi:peptide/nickel transport system substrate-binding protein
VVILNTRKPPFDNLQVRQAMRYPLDRETIAKTILGGIGKAQVQVAAPGTPAYDPKLDEEFAFNPAKARELLTQAGLAGKTAKVSGLVSTSTQESPEIAQIVQGDLKGVGIEVNLNIVEPSRFFPIYFAGNFDISFSFLTLATIDPTDFTISSAYRLNATNPAWLETGPPKEYIDSIQKLNATVDRRERWSNLRVAVRYLLDQAWALPTNLRLPTYGIAKPVHGFGVDPQMLLTLKSTWVDR